MGGITLDVDGIYRGECDIQYFNYFHIFRRREKDSLLGENIINELTEQRNVLSSCVYVVLLAELHDLSDPLDLGLHVLYLPFSKLLDEELYGQKDRQGVLHREYKLPRSIHRLILTIGQEKMRFQTNSA